MSQLRPLPPVRRILPACLFLSGFCALAYEVSWARYLTKFLGATAPAYTIVLATFMGGLAAGAWIFGRRADRTDRPLRMYARLELWVAAVCFAFPLVMDVLGPLYMMVARPFVDLPAIRHLLRVILAVLVLAPPSILMGGTLPAATRFYVRSLNGVGAGVGRLYFVNAFGAVFGTLAAGFFLIPGIGLHGTFWLAAAVNAAIGLWALRVSRRIDGASACPAAGWEEDVETDLEPPPTESPLPVWVATAALVATAASGAASMIYEVSWIRLLTLVLGGSTYAFTIMLAAFILGIALGSGLVSASTRLSRGGLALFGWLEIVVAFVVLAMVPIYNRLSYIYVGAASGIPRVPEAYPQFLFVGFVLSVAVMLVPTVLLGATFPLAARLSARSISTLGGGVGRAYAFNTAGTLLGTAAAAHLLFPWIGLYGTFAFAAALNVAAGLFCLLGAARMRFAKDAPERPPAAVRVAAFVGLAAVTTAFALLLTGGPRLDQQVLSRGMFRSMSGGFDSYAEYRAWIASSTDIPYYRDGAEDTVAILDYRGHITLQVNGKADASSEGDMPTQICVGHLPLLIHPNPERVVVVGLGSGATSAAILAHPDVKLTTVELSPQVVEAAVHFAPFTRNVIEDPRLDLVLEDAKAYLGLTRERFDVIVSEPSNPWVAGNANLFTLEFFELMRSRLADGGIVLQWFHDYEMTDETVKTILRTFTEAYPYARLFHCGAGRDFALIGSEQPLAYAPDRIEAALAASALVREDLETHLFIRSPLGIYARNVLDDAGLRALAEGGRIHRDRRPVLDFQAPRGVFLRSMSTLVREADQRWLEPDEADLLITRFTGGAPLDSDEAFSEVVENMTAPFDRLRQNVIRKWVDATDSTEAHRRLARELVDIDWRDDALDIYRLLTEQSDDPGDQLERWRLEALVAFSADGGDPAAVRTAIAKLWSLAALRGDAETWARVGETAAEVGLPDEAAAAYEKALARTEEAAFWDRLARLIGLARAQRRAGDEDAARETLAILQGLRPDYWPLLVELEELGLSGDDLVFEATEVVGAL
jgi:spermidine synthase